MKIRPARPDDVDSMMGLASASLAAAHWSRDQYQQFFSDEPSRRFLIVAEDETSSLISLLGFLVARHLPPDWELENVVVAPTAQRRGIGKRLLGALFAAARETNSEAVFLEVRESNASARRLYEKAGFHPQGRRKSYYSNPIEDAILYRRDLG
ncbi:MAG TPA: ribosomal protein S18-alanine N-acetyltransferase [Candidatus Sulfotelmatobacter sp.]|nr:ribosomal protein S18-alanine N-acetyltransferase [Candidatus Sulfotelmatobacter sp.]